MLLISRRQRTSAPLWIGVWLASCVITLPFLVKQSSWSEWANPYWLLLEQREHIRSSGFPAFAVNSDVSGMGYPHHVFYAGFTLMVMAYLSLVLHPWLIFCLSIALGYVLTWFGSYWLYLAIDNRATRRAVLLASTVLATPYILTNMYGRGAWAEHLGSGAAIFLLGAIAGQSAVESQRQWVRPLLGSVLLFSTHNISVLLGLLVGLPVLGVTARGLRVSRRALLHRFLGAFCGMCLVAPFLLPNLVYGSSTRISSWNISQSTSAFDSLRVIFSPFLYFPKDQQAANVVSYGQPVEVRIFAQTCVVLFVIAALLLLRRIFVGVWREWSNVLELGLALLLVSVLLVLMTQTDLWSSKLGPLFVVQFPYRLHPYLALTIGLVVVLLLKEVNGARSGRLFGSLLGVGLVWSVALGAYQVLTAKQTTPPGFEKASHQKIEDGNLPPVFRVGTAPPIQFRLVNQSAEVPGSRSLWFGPSGEMLSQLDIEMTVSTEQIDESPSVLLSLGSVGNGTALGISRLGEDCLLTLDRWGVPPQEDRFVCDSDEVNLSVQIIRSEARMRVVGPAGQVLTYTNLIGIDGKIELLRETVDFSTMEVNPSVAIIVGYEESRAPQIQPGTYNTNVVASPFSKFVQPSEFEANSAGTWNVSVDNTNPMWSSVVPMISKVGTLIAAVSLLGALITMIRPWHKRRWRAHSHRISARGGT